MLILKSRFNYMILFPILNYAPESIAENCAAYRLNLKFSDEFRDAEVLGGGCH